MPFGLAPRATTVTGWGGSRRDIRPSSTAKTSKPRRANAMRRDGFAEVGALTTPTPLVGPVIAPSVLIARVTASIACSQLAALVEHAL
jgi:hypothetical protein